jgi:hypothetical protein
VQDDGPKGKVSRAGDLERAITAPKPECADSAQRTTFSTGTECRVKSDHH